MLQQNKEFLFGKVFENVLIWKFNTSKKFPASPTYTNVVYILPINVNKTLTNLGQIDLYITVDEFTYAVAKKIQWQVPALRDIRLGGFHRAKTFLVIIGKRMKSSGFEEIITPFQLFGWTNIEGIFSFFYQHKRFIKIKNSFWAFSRAIASCAGNSFRVLLWKWHALAAHI